MEIDSLYFAACLDSPVQGFTNSILQEGFGTMVNSPKRSDRGYLHENTPSYPRLRVDGAAVEQSDEEVQSWSGSIEGERCSSSDTWNLDERKSTVIPTPPPDASPNGSTDDTCAAIWGSKSVTHGESFVKGTSLDETPASSPENIADVDGETSLEPAAGDTTEAEAEEREEKEDARDGVSARLSLKRSRSGSEEDSSEDEDMPVPKNLKLPQRKGGMQLWQFLYTLLTDPKKQYSELIQWTDKDKHREFRLQEPEAIAIWWGEHKNKKNMSYDKLSRSLRYYYDKGIIRKIPGERYVYQFCVDPEMMYEHIGISESRPKLKPMPRNARLAMSKYQQERSIMAMDDPYKMMAGLPSPLQFVKQNHVHHLPHCMLPPLPLPLPPPPPPPSYDSYMLDTIPFSCVSGPAPMLEDFKPSLNTRCQSAPSLIESQKFLFEQQFQVPYHHSMSQYPAVESLPVPVHRPPPSHPSVSSCHSLPLSPHTYTSDSDDLELDELIAFTSCDSYNHSPSVVSSCDGSPYFPVNQGVDDADMSSWSFN